MEPYYYNQLTKAEQSIYTDMKNGLLSLEKSFLIPGLEGRELTELYWKLRLDCPEIFYTTGFRCRRYPGSGNVELVPEYLYDKAKIKEQQKAMKARLEKLVRQAPKGSEWEKEQYVHDFICQYVHYDKLKKPYSHEITGPLGQGVGVCEGIAKTVKLLCDALGIWCIVVISEANPEKKIRYRHAWNVVRIGGTYYHLDVTFDNTLGQKETLRYDYFNLDDKQIFRDHEAVIGQVPSCSDGNHFYYKERKLSFTKMEEVKKRAQQAAKKEKLLLFHWRGGYLTREVLTELLELLTETGTEKGKYIQVGVNWPQAVLQVQYTGKLPENRVVIEEANEGEAEVHEAGACGAG